VRSLIAALGCVALLAVSGCGSQPSAQHSAQHSAQRSAGASTSPTPSSSTTTSQAAALPDWPGCASVWQVGQKLPGRYAGCLAGDTAVAADKRICESGQVLVTFRDSFYAVRGGLIARADNLRTDKAYRGKLHRCTA
jgi:hypothetical protein